MNLGYEYRPNGNFLVRLKCSLCGEGYDAHALSNLDSLGYCPCCRQVYEWQLEEAKRAGEPQKP